MDSKNMGVQLCGSQYVGMQCAWHVHVITCVSHMYMQDKTEKKKEVLLPICKY